MSPGAPPRYLLDSRLRPVAQRLLHRHWDLHIDPGGLPGAGPVIVAANHIGVVDGPLLAVMASRPVHVLTKEEMFHGITGVFLRQSGQIRLDRFHLDRAAVRRSIATLEEGRLLGIFPEGRRGAGDFVRIHRGAAYLALVTGAPILPLLFFGTRAPGEQMGWVPPTGTRIDMVFGKPFVLDQVKWPRTRETVQAATAALHEHLVAHLATTRAAAGLSLPGPLPIPEDD